VFFDLTDARAVIEAWRVEYNELRPHSSLGQLAPSEYARSLSVAAGCLPTVFALRGSDAIK